MEKKERKPAGYWDVKENCIKDAKKYETRKKWQKNSGGAYNAARRNKWLDECYKHMKKRNSWTKENCIKDAKKYNTITDWFKKSSGAYTTARKKKWLDECCEHMIPLGNRHKRMVYCYVFSDKSCYIGLTFNEEKRKYAHLNSTKSNSPVFNHIKKTNLIPEYIKISDYILDIEAQKIESDTINEYKKNGYNILNTARAGGLGGNFIKWTKEECIKDAKKYNAIKEWEKNSRGACASARKNKWLDECCKHMKKRNSWTKENCIKDAKKYKSRYEWEKNSSTAYGVAWKNKWLDECCEHMNTKIKKPAGYWDVKENCIKDAKKYKSRYEWQKNSKGAYNAARRNKWLDECFPPKKLVESLEMV